MRLCSSYHGSICLGVFVCIIHIYILYVNRFLATKHDANPSEIATCFGSKKLECPKSWFSDIAVAKNKNAAALVDFTCTGSLRWANWVWFANARCVRLSGSEKMALLTTHNWVVWNMFYFSIYWEESGIITIHQNCIRSLAWNGGYPCWVQWFTWNVITLRAKVLGKPGIPCCWASTAHLWSLRNWHSFATADVRELLTQLDLNHNSRWLNHQELAKILAVIWWTNHPKEWVQSCFFYQLAVGFTYVFFTKAVRWWSRLIYLRGG